MAIGAGGAYGGFFISGDGGLELPAYAGAYYGTISFANGGVATRNVFGFLGNCRGYSSGVPVRIALAQLFPDVTRDFRSDTRIRKCQMGQTGNTQLMTNGLAKSAEKCCLR